MSGNPTSVRGNGPIRFGSRTGCWTFVFRADVETPGGRRSRRSLGLFWFPQFLCQAKLWLQDWDAKKKGEFAILFKGGGCWDEIDEVWWIWIWYAMYFFLVFDVPAANHDDVSLKGRPRKPSCNPGPCQGCGPIWTEPFTYLTWRGGEGKTPTVGYW